ncbi:hypothetical protein [Limnoglobus roseus]|uniref:hypothetical protein n=1 Tax=Limnoglobus roseus TaxID=2598579 RepID=UPI0011EAE905
MRAFKMSSDIQDQIPELERPCETCRGQRGSDDCYSRRYMCPECDGAGFVPTEFGVKILQSMRHNFRPMRQATTS